MDMVNDGKDIRLDTPQAVKEALASGKDLYNPQTGEFWWEYNYTGSIANTYVHLDDPNLLAVIDNPDFDLYEDIVGGLNYTGYITDSIETIIEDGEENAPLIDPRDEMFAQIASEDGWVIASPENVRAAVQSHMAEHGGDVPGKENDMGFYHVDTTDIPPDEYIRINSRNVDMVVDEIYDELNSTVKSDYHDDFKRYLAVLNEEHHGGTNSLTGIPFDINETMENGGAYYNPERGIVIASFLLEQTSPRIEAYYGYTPYALASLIGKNADVTVDSDVMDIQDILADPSLPRRFDHELASFDSVEELIASRWSPTGAGWLDMSGHDGLASAMGALGIKQTDNVREWYALAFPGDELAVAINPSLTFDNAIAAVPTGDGFYTALGDAADSLLRERIFEELCNRYGYTYDEVYDSWLNESPLPSPAISQQPEKIAVAAGYRFNLVDAKEASGIDLKGCGTVVTVDGHDYEIMKGATYEDSRKVDDLLDSHGDKPISAFRKQPQGMSLKQAVREAREASAKLAEENGGTDDPDGKDER